MLEDLTNLTPKRLERRLEELARDALPCVSAVAFDANPDQGLSVGLWVESNQRRDVIDLARVLETEPGGHVAAGWSLLSQSRSHPYSRLLLRVQFERPVMCTFVVRFDVRDDANDQLRLALPLLAAASGFALAFNGFPGPGTPVTWIPAPTARHCLFELLCAVGS